MLDWEDTWSGPPLSKVMLKKNQIGLSSLVSKYI